VKEPIVSLKNVSFKYSNSSFYALRDINLEIFEGDFLLITGPSGCGKTTLIRLLNGLIPNYYEGDLEGEIIVFKHNVKNTPTYKLATYVGLVFQNPEDQLFTTAVEKEIAFGLENLGLKREVMLERINEILKITKIEHLRYKLPFLLSGGEQQKVAISSVLALYPKILALDEPFSNLDPLSALFLSNFLNFLNKERKITIIIAEHRLDLLAKFSNRIAIMNEGKIIIEGNTKDIIENFDIKKYGINEPKLVTLCKILRNKYNINIDISLSIEDFLNNFKK